MHPDEEGTMFSGCAVKNKRGMLGLPSDAILYFYTCAERANHWSEGKNFTKKIAYSIDQGKEWACTEGVDGYANQYEIEIYNLRILNLSADEYTILHFLVDIDDYDAIIGYRADNPRL